MVPLTVAFKNKTMGNKKRNSGPIKGTKTAAKIKKKIAARSFVKGLPDAGTRNFFREDKMLKIYCPAKRLMIHSIKEGNAMSMTLPCRNFSLYWFRM